MKAANVVVWGTIGKSLAPNELKRVAGEVGRVRANVRHIIFPVEGYSLALISQVRSLTKPGNDLIVFGSPSFPREIPADTSGILFPANLIGRPAAPPFAQLGGSRVFALVTKKSLLAENGGANVFRTPLVKGAAPKGLSVEYNLSQEILESVDKTGCNILVHFSPGTFRREAMSLLADRAGINYIVHVGRGIPAEHYKQLPETGRDLGEIGDIRPNPHRPAELEIPWRLLSEDSPKLASITVGRDLSLMRIMAIGDVVGRAGVGALDRFLSSRNEKPDLLIVQTENSAERQVTVEEQGLSNGTCVEIFDVMKRHLGDRYWGTGGNHSLEYIPGRKPQAGLSPLDLEYPSVKSHISLPFNFDLTSDEEIKPGLILAAAGRTLGIDQAWLANWDNYIIDLDGRRLLMLNLLLAGTESAGHQGGILPVLNQGAFSADFREKMLAIKNRVDAAFIDVHSETTAEREEMHFAMRALGESKLCAAWCTHQHQQQTKAYLIDGQLFAYDIGSVSPLLLPEYAAWIKSIAGALKKGERACAAKDWLSPQFYVTGLEFILDPKKARVVNYQFIQEVVS